MILNSIAIEDEPHALDLLEHHAKQISFINWLGGFRQPLDALPLINAQKVDLLFLDINLSQMNGLSFYRSLVHKPKVIFTTAYAEFAAESYTIEALDYLVKPIELDRFVQACNKAQRSLPSTDTVKPEQREKQETLYLKSGAKWHQLQWPEVSHLEKSENYVIFHTLDGKKILSRQNMTDVESLMPSFFCRVHKSFIVNLKQIEVIEREKITINKQTIPLADSYRESFLQRVGIRQE
ncbi:MAG TPA: LytTR family DNA-binding domain-containing protein [Cyclobacteriaceae bacterium]